MDVSVRELKNHLSAYLRRVQAGEEIMVTSRGRRIARLAQALAEASDPDAAAIERLRKQPWLTAARKPGKPQGAKYPVRVPAGTTEEIMHWARGE